MVITDSTATGLDAYLKQTGGGGLPKIAGTYTGGLVVCGDAACVWDDLERFKCKSVINGGRVLKPGWQFLTVNKLVEVFPGDVEHCYSNSSRCLNLYVPARRDEYAREFGGSLHKHSISTGVENVWPFNGCGTSGLGAVLTGIGLGYQRIVLCGLPLDDGPHNGEPPWRTTAFASSEAAGAVGSDRNGHWELAKIAFDGKVRSMSGRTKKWLGDAMEWA